MINLILPHVQEDVTLSTDFADRSLAPLLTLLFALVGGAH
jgi:hypothetical protein